MHGNARSDQPVEEHAPMRGLAPVEPERELVQAGLQVIGLERPLMRAHQPALYERSNAAYARPNLVGFFAGALDRRSLVDIFIFGCTGIGCRPTGVDRRARFDVFLNQSLGCFGFGVGDDLRAAAPKSFRGKQFNSDRHQHFAPGTTPALAVPHPSKDCFARFDVPGQPIVPGMADCAPEPVQHRPRRLTGAEPEDPMQGFGGNAIFSGGQMPSGGKPDGQRRSGVVKDRARRGGYAAGTRLAPPLSAFHAPRRGASTIRANKAVRPPNPIRAVKTGSIIRKPCQKLGVVARVIDPGPG